MAAAVTGVVVVAGDGAVVVCRMRARASYWGWSGIGPTVKTARAARTVFALASFCQSSPFLRPLLRMLRYAVWDGVG